MTSSFRSPLIVVSLLFCFTLSSAQKRSIYQFPKKVPERYIVDARMEYEKMMKEKPKGISKAKYSRFAEMMSYEKKSQFLSGQVYIGWGSMENYLNDVLQKILPDNLKGDPRFHVYVARNPDYNAYAIHDGSFFFNIGFLADLENEAAIALILGHELSHFIGNDALDKYKTRIKMMRKSNRKKVNFDLRVKNAHNDRKQEHEADSLGFLFANTAGYDIRNGFNVFYQFLDIDKKFESIKKQPEKKSKKSKDNQNDPARRTGKPQKKVSSEADTIEIDITEILEKMLASHPENMERIDYLEKVYDNLEEKGDKDFIVSESTFTELQQDARVETLELLLHQFKYSQCVERAFAYYLFEPTNDTYIYYLCEAIRRDMVFKPYFKDRGFLTDEYRNIFKKKHGVLHNLRVLIRDSSRFEEIVATELVNDSVYEFETYEQAFRYFSKKALDHKIPEMYLTAALYEPPKSEAQRKFLEQYIAIPGIRFKEFAENLATNKLNKALKDNKKEIILFDDLSFLEDHYYGLHERHLKSESKNEKYISELEAFVNTEFPNKKFVRLSELKQDNLTKAVDYIEAMETMTMLEIVKANEKRALDIEQQDAEEEAAKEAAKNKKKKKARVKRKKVNRSEKLQQDLFNVDPYFWQLFKDYDIKTLEFVKVYALDDRTSRTKYLNPIRWGLYPYQLFVQVFYGSMEYKYQMYYFSFMPTGKQDKAFYYKEECNSKLTILNLLNSFYYATQARDNTN
jgi:Zn-dependent protease with chaperone function